LQETIAVAGTAVAFLALAGVVVRRRVGACWTFALYLGVIVVTDLMMLLWPDASGSCGSISARSS